METTSKKPLKPFALLIPILSIAVVLVVGYKGFGWDKFIQSELNLKFDNPMVELITSSTPASPLPREGKDALDVWQQYLTAAHAHDLAKIRELSYQISDTCNDPGKIPECNHLMDSVYTFGTWIDPKSFRYMMADDRQMVLYTDGPTVAILFLTRDTGALKILGMRLCAEGSPAQPSCTEESSIKSDANGNGWWDSVEAIFYKK